MPPTDATLLLQQISAGDRAASDKLMDVVYAELHALASAQMRGQAPGHTLQPTALVNEAWLKLVNLKDPQWSGRRHFFQVGAKAMRSVLIDHVRAKRRKKRASGEKVELFESAVAVHGSGPLDIVSLDDTLKQLNKIDPMMADLVELRFFGGRSMEEAAECLQVSLSKVERTWRLAKAWLFREMGGSTDRPTASS